MRALLGVPSCTCHSLRRCAGLPEWSSSKPFTTFPHSIPSSLCVMPHFSSIKRCYHILNPCPSIFCAPPFLPHQPSPSHQFHWSYSTAALTPQPTHSHRGSTGQLCHVLHMRAGSGWCVLCVVLCLPAHAGSAVFRCKYSQRRSQPTRSNEGVPAL